MQVKFFFFNGKAINLHFDFLTHSFSLKIHLHKSKHVCNMKVKSESVSCSVVSDSLKPHGL